MMDKKEIDWLKKELRRTSYKWQPRKLALARARVSRGKYTCALCQEIFGNKFIQLDHINPVIEPGVGFVDWNTYVERLFCDTKNYQVLCKGCHGAKTLIENEKR
jgi:5-methylcytosine-specific restriction endonuclease McrA